MGASELRSIPTSLDQTRAQLTAAWDVRGIDVDTVRLEGGTAVARRRIGPDRAAFETLPPLLEPGPEGTAPQFRLGGPLGEGGMGIVREAEQTALGRFVAVKGPREESDVDEAAPQLFREARVTGVLEHPNVVPIYALGRDAQNRPLIVMRRVEGRSWLELLQEGTPEERTTDDHLQRHLRILVQVARALSFAHDKGIVHRDVKPENVMIGSYGEVYVLDWGIAVSVDPDGPPGVPQASDIAAIEGTPVYMAPEMAAGDGEVIDPRTDVYLLGATLHEIVTGAPPHEAATLVGMLTRAFASEPHDYGSEAPRDLVEICHRAMARLPEDRYQSAGELAEAVEAFLVHRASTQLSDEAEGLLGDLGARLDAAAGAEDPDLVPIYATFRECRFAFSQALRSWPDNVAATEGLQRALERMIRFELDRDAPHAAARLLAELPRPVETLAREVERGLSKWRQAQAELERLKRDADLSIGQPLRRSATFALGLFWLLACLLCGWLTRSAIWAVTPMRFAVLNGLMALLVLSIFAVGRRRLLANAANRRIGATALVLFGTHTLLWAVGGWVGVEAYKLAMLHCVVGVGTWGIGTVSVDRRWAPIPAGLALGLVLIYLMPTYYFELIGAAGGLSAALGTMLGERGAPASRSTLPSRDET